MRKSKNHLLSHIIIWISILSILNNLYPYGNITTVYASTEAPITDAKSTNTTIEDCMEVAALILQGKQTWQKISFDDLDVINISDVRYLPLIRLLAPLDGIATENGNNLEIKIKSLPDVIINKSTKEITINGKSKQINIIEAQSAITGKMDIYLPPDIISEILGIDLKWDDQSFSFSATIERKLSTWESNFSSLLGISTTMVGQELPEILPPAIPNKTSLDFIRTRFRINSSPISNDTSNKIVDDSPRLTAWGNLSGGKYKVEFSTPSLLNSNNPGTNSSGISWIDWRYRFSNAELVAGDSRFGLSDLVFPYTALTGLRVSGILGKGESSDVNSNYTNFQSSFFKEKVFQGYAPVGSTVEIYINNRLVNTVQVTTGDPNEPTAMGIWRFEDIALSVGRMNEVQIVITDSSGNKTQTKETILESSLLIPKGKAAYIGVFGTHRNIGVSTGDAGGTLGGARLVYGLSDKFTVGASTAIFDGFFTSEPQQFANSTRLFYPRTGINTGLEFAWMPIKPVLLYGGAATSKTKNKDSNLRNSDSALQLKGDIYLSKPLKLGFQIFNFGPHYFNGQILTLQNKKGYTLGAQWIINPKTSAEALTGNIAGSLEEETGIMSSKIGIQHLGIFSNLMPNTNLAINIDRISPSSKEKTRSLSTLEIRSQLSDIALYGLVSSGNNLIQTNTTNFFDGLSLPMVNLFETPRSAFMMGKPIAGNQFLTLSYWSSNSGRRASIIHDLRNNSSNSLLSGLFVHTEIGRSLDTKTLFFENRLEYDIDPAKSMRIGVNSRLERDNWRVMLVLDKSDLFGFSEGSPRKITSKSVNPEMGAVQGIVFLDANGNGIKDRGEAGLSNIRVTNDSRYSVIADSGGYFIIPGTNRIKKDKVYLDMNSVPAIYSPTNGSQVAFIDSGNVTSVSLGLSPVHSITGLVLLNESVDSKKPIKGTRVFITKKDDDKAISESITSSDGSYYISDIRPGSYVIKVDTKTIPPSYTLTDNERDLEIQSKQEVQEIKLPSFEASLSK